MPYKDPEEAKAAAARSRRKCRDRVNAYQREYYAKNIDKKRKYFSQWVKDNRDGVNSRLREKYATNEDYRETVKDRVTARRWTVRKEDRAAVAAMRKEECFYCGREGGEIDHLTPRSRGGVNELWNLVPSCKSCNSRKNDLSLDEFYKKYPISIL